MAPRSFDVIVAGLGAMGSAAAGELAGRGARVLGLDRFHPPHTLGSTHGKSRVIREAYFEDPLYVPLVQRAYALWDELAAASGRALLRPTGALMIGPPEGEVVAGALASARRHGLPHEQLSGEELVRRYPALAPDPGMVAVFEPRAGVLDPEAAVEAMLARAAGRGAELRFDEAVEAIRVGEGEVEVRTAAGLYRASRLLLAAGAWTAALLPDLSLALAVERQVVVWLAPKESAKKLGLRTPLGVSELPITLWDYAPGRFWYSLPDLGHGFKAGFHHQGETVDAETVERTVGEEETAALRRVVERYVPAAWGRLLAASVCLYTNTPDSHFLLDFHPAHRELLIASPCSGHGFKFAPALGEVAADLLLDGAARFDLAPFQIDRLLARSTA